MLLGPDSVAFMSLANVAPSKTERDVKSKLWFKKKLHLIKEVRKKQLYQGW